MPIQFPFISRRSQRRRRSANRRLDIHCHRVVATRLEHAEERLLLTASWALAPDLPYAVASAAVATGADGRVYEFGGSSDGRNPIASAEAFDAATNAWSAIASMPTARSLASAARGADGRIYVFGGTDAGGAPTDTAEAYSPASNSWSPVAHMPNANFNGAAVAMNDGLIYVLGGSNLASSLEAYNPANDQWTTLAGMPQPRAAFAAAAGADGRIYAIGGQTSSGAIVNTVEAYDPGTNRWTTAANMPTARDYAGAATGIDGRIYVCGGNGGLYPNNAILNTVEAYDPSTNAWSTAQSMPDARYAAGAAAAQDGRIYVVGGDDSGGPTSTVQLLQFPVPGWTTGPDLTYPVAAAAAATGDDGRVYVFGGSSDGLAQHPLADAEAFDPAIGAWTSVAGMPVAREGAVAATGDDGRIYLFGGDDGTGQPTTTVEVYSPASNTWSMTANMPFATFSGGSAAALENGLIYVVGTSNLAADFAAYNPSTNSWTTLAPMPTPRNAFATAAGSDGRVYVIGGQTSNGAASDIVESYDPGTDSWNSVESMPTARYYLGAATAGDGRIYALGGYILPTVESYDPHAKTWSTAKNMPHAVYAAAVTAGPDGSIYVIGGDDSGGPTSAVQVWAAQTTTGALRASGETIAATEGAAISTTVATFNDTDADPASNFTAAINWGDGTSSTGTVSAGTGGGFTVAGNHTFVEEGSYATTISLRDRDGSVATATGVATVADTAVDALGLTFSATEGQAASLTVANFTDVNGGESPSDYSATIDWGDGSSSAGTITYDAGLGLFAAAANHAYAQAGHYRLQVAISHDGAPPTKVTSVANVADAPLSVQNATLSVIAGQAFTATVATFTDANRQATPGDFTVAINWGDGTSSTGTVIANSATFDMVGEHTYTTPGRFPVAWKVFDKGGIAASGTSSATSASPGRPGNANVTISEIPLSDPDPQHRDNPTAITVGPDGNIWFTDEQDQIGEINPASSGINRFQIPTANGGGGGITAGPDGNLWITEPSADCSASVETGIPGRLG